MDKVLRTSLRTVVAACHQVLEEDVRRQIEGTYGVTPRGEFIAREDVEPHAVDVREWRREREVILAAIAHIESYGADRGHAVEQFVRESAFTVLNRLAALKLMEHPSRGLIPESVGRGKDSKGFALFQKISPEVCRAARNGPVLDSRFRLFFESIFDDLADELGVLFDRRLPQSIIFPSEACLKRVLNLLNQTDVATVWSDDETIGWIYQYFIPKELRDEARKASQAPRNSYELAFRNQFFTPRYVVEFLVDNTLGRIWYEMRRGETRLVDACKYLIRGTGDAFLDPGVTSPTNALAAVSIESSFRRLNHVPYRPKKDPRDLRLLDPACGSGHFLLYAYDIFETICVEAWDDAEGPSCEETGRRLRDDYPEREALKRAIPELIVGHNLHGTDIDLRATQIAALAMWLRAQRSYQEQGFKVSDRPRITRSNIVCAEPMPGERELLEEFVATIQPKLLGQLVRVVFDKMALAGEAGSLLPIEDEIRGAVAEAKRQWQAGPQPEQLMLFPVAQRRSEQLALFDVRGITDESFWHEAEGRVVESLHEYARKAANGRSYRRRLFVEDATQGFAFIDIARKRFDVVLMNPPFGEASRPSKAYFEAKYPRSKHDVYAAFVERALGLLARGGVVGALTSRAGFYLSSFEKWRKEVLLEEARPTVLADLGQGVLDTAMVETAAYVLERDAEPTIPSLFFRLLSYEDKPTLLIECVGAVRAEAQHAAVHSVHPQAFSLVPGACFSYWVGANVLELFQRLTPLESGERVAKRTNGTTDDRRWIRAWWEVAPSTIGRAKGWVPHAKGGSYSRYYGDVHLVIAWNSDEQTYPGYDGTIHRPDRRPASLQYFFRPGLTWPRRTQKGLNVRALPAACIFGDKGPSVFLPGDDATELLRALAVMNSTAFRALVELQLSFGSYEAGVLQSTPFPDIGTPAAAPLALLARRCVDLRRQTYLSNETSLLFEVPSTLRVEGDGIAARSERWREQIAAAEGECARLEQQIDEIVFELYGVNQDDRRGLKESLRRRSEGVLDEEEADDGEEKEDGDEGNAETKASAVDLISYAVGCAVGRWDVRLAINKRREFALADPFDSLPPFPPGSLDPGRRLDGQDPTAGYPLRVDSDGMLVDDPGHADDVVRRVREVLELIWPGAADWIEKEVCECLAVSDLRDYFRNPRGFFDHHIKRYSKSRRKAPIFWLLQSSKKAYGLWIYYSRLNRDTVFKALRNYVEPKIKGEATRLKELKGRLEQGRETLERRERSKLEKEVERQDSLLGELGTFKESLERVSALGYEPELDDGVVLNIAPFHDLTPWKEARTYWKELLDGGYAWSTIAKRLRAREIAGTPPGRSAGYG